MITRWFLRRRIRLYGGRKWKQLAFGRWHRGWRFGGFSRTQALAVFRKKTLTKKVKVVPLKQKLQEEARIAEIKKVKAGQRRRHVISFAYEKVLAVEFASIDA